MRITIWGINYAPELTGIAPYNTELCEFLASRGHSVRMITTFPYYPEWRKRPEDKGRLYAAESRQNVEVVRCWHYVPARPTALKRMLHEATFGLTSLLRVLRGPRPDVLLLVCPPLLLGPLGWLAGRLLGCRVVIHVQDMQPDAALALGMLKPGLFSRALYAVERFSYSRAWRVSGITRGMLRLFSAKGIPEKRQIYWPNWITGTAAPQAERRPKTFRQTHAISPDEFLVVYSGNLGRKQGLDVILQAAQVQAARANAVTAGTGQSKPARPLRFLIVGDGVERAGLMERARELRLTNVAFLPLQPQAMFRAMLEEGDLFLVTQQAGSGALFFPSKLLSLLSAGCPVITVADAEGELASAVREGGFGRNVLPGKPEDLADAIAAVAADAALREQFSRAGRSWVRQFERSSVLTRIEKVLTSGN